ncbi:MAG: DUF2828 family protein [Terrisporobacter sp.]
MAMSFFSKLKEELLNIDSDIYEEIYGDKASIDVCEENKQLLFFYKHILNIYNKNIHLNKAILKKSLDENFEATMKVLLYSRDIKYGLGMRESFRDALFYIACNYNEDLEKYIKRIIKVGRFDDLYSLFDTKYESLVVECFKNQLNEDIISESPSNLCKWLKSINTSSKESRRLGRKTAEGLGLSYSEYRKLLSDLRSKINLTEQKISLNNWNDINYENVPKLAYKKYYNAFKTNDYKRFNEYIRYDESVEVNKVGESEYISKLRELLSGDLDDLEVKKYKELIISLSEKNAGNWITASCINEFDIKNETKYLLETLVINLYFLLNNVGKFEKYFFKTNGIENFKKVKSENLMDLIRELVKSSICKNINIECILDLILFAAIKNNMIDEELPSGILIIVHDISEIENIPSNANICSNEKKVHFNLENIKEKWNSAKYTLPEIKICILGNSSNNLSVIKENDDFSIIRGFNDNIFNFIINGDLVTRDKIENDKKYVAVENIEKILNDERYI